PIHISLLFDTNEDQLSYSMLNSIDDLTEAIKAEPNSLIRIDGFADSRGSKAYNLDLAHRRAENVANYLVEQGIDRNRIVVRSMGESQASASSDDYLAYAQDRKVELSLDSSLTASSTPSCDETSSSANDSCGGIKEASLIETSENTLAELDDGLAQGN
ncbi:MAG: OmpA family protein, partial [Pseudomonadales bacterium]